MKTYVVQLESHDDVISARDKISWSKAPRVLLVWPRQGNILERRVDLLLLLRHAQSMGAQLAFVTRSAEVRRQARQLGIPLFRDAARAQRAPWRKPWFLLRLPSLLRSRVRSDPASLRSRGVELRQKAPLNPWLRYAAFAAGLLAFLALIAAFAPQAQIEIAPVREVQQMEIEAWAEPSVPSPSLSGALPAELLSVVVEGSSQAESTGSSPVPARRSSGHVQLINLTNEIVDLPKGTVVYTLTGAPVRFQTMRFTRLLAGTEAPTLVPVQALLPGRRGNVAAGQIAAMEGPAAQLVAVENLEPTRNGLDRAAPAPTEADYKQVKASLLLRLQETALEELGAQYSTYRLFGETLRARAVIAEEQNPPVGQPGDPFELTLQIEFEAWAVHEDHVRAMAQAALDANLPRNYQAVPGTLDITLLETAPGAQHANRLLDQPLRQRILASRELEPQLAKEGLIGLVKGRRVSRVEQMLQSSLTLSKPPRVQINPDWWPLMPLLPSSIRVEVQR